MLEHFGARIQEKPDGMKLNRDNYADITKFKSRPAYYSEAIIDNTKRLALLNLDINMKFFKGLDGLEFSKVIDEFILKTSFKEITDLEEYRGASGYYLLVLDGYSQSYVGIAKDIKRRITSHWSKQVGLDRLIFGDTKTSKISVDSFRALDTTRIYVRVDSNPSKNEDLYIDLVQSEFCLNRTKGGKLSGGLAEAIVNRKSNNIPISDDFEGEYAELKQLLDKRKELMDIARESRSLPVNNTKRRSVKNSNRKNAASYSKSKDNDLMKLYLAIAVVVVILGLIFLVVG